MGVILQALNRDLARANGISQLTRDGQTGAIVSYVYPGSPADQAGVRPGWIILRLHVEGTAKPLEVNVSYDRYADWEFPWDRLDEVPDQVLERVPAPWPAVQDNFTRMITGIGFGKTYRAELVVDGKVVFKDFTVVESPPHYRTAPKFKSDALGVTVRDMTYEVRRYLQKTPEDPGVVVARVEPGSKIAVAGVKPFEVITHVNDKPVRTVEEFQKAIGGQKVLRLSVNRRLTGRVVKVETSGE
jgi:S1-C subfamily serine protease